MINSVLLTSFAALDKTVAYLKKVTSGDEEGRILVLAFGALFSQRRQGLQTQLTDL